MPKLKNEPIGECPCPTRGCERACKVFKFRARPDVTRQRLAGKVYAQCPEHGRFGADGAQGMIDWIMENTTLWTPENRKDHEHAPAPVPASTPATPPATTITPITAAPRTTTTPPTSPPAPAPAPRSRNVWEL